MDFRIYFIRFSNLGDYTNFLDEKTNIKNNSWYHLGFSSVSVLIFRLWDMENIGMNKRIEMILNYIPILAGCIAIGILVRGIFFVR